MNSPSSTESEDAADVDAADVDAAAEAVRRLIKDPMDRNDIIELIAENLGDPQTLEYNLLLKINEDLREKKGSMIALVYDSNNPDAPHGSYIPQLIPKGKKKTHFYTIALQHESDKKKNQLITYTNGLQEITVDLQNRLMYLPDELIAQYETDLERSPGIFKDRFRKILNASVSSRLIPSQPIKKQKQGGKTRKNKGTPQKKSSAHKTTRKNPKNIRQAKK